MEKLSDFYNAIYTGAPTKWDGGERDWFAFNMLNEIVGEPKSVLDYGCGNGHTLAYLKREWPNASYYGLDISPVALRLAKQRVPDGEFYGELPDQKWELITIMGVAEHFDNPTWELHEISGHLTPGGHIYLEAPNNLAYSPGTNEGWRADFGTMQFEWHWERTTWENAIQEAELKIVKAIRGFSKKWEFVWILQ